MTRALVLLALAVAAVACGSSSSSDEGAVSASEVTTTEKDAGACQPCAEKHAKGAKVYDSARRHCFCADEVCRDACAATQCTGSTPKPADDTCNACIDDQYSTCLRVVQAACEEDADCLKYVSCKTDDPCAPQK